jgi:hypothetical protein
MRLCELFQRSLKLSTFKTSDGDGSAARHACVCSIHSVLPLAALHHFGNWKGSEEKVCTTSRLCNGFQKISFGRSRDKIEQQIVAENARTSLGQISLKKTSIVTGTSEQARPKRRGNATMQG